MPGWTHQKIEKLRTDWNRLVESGGSQRDIYDIWTDYKWNQLGNRVSRLRDRGYEFKRFKSGPRPGAKYRKTRG